jgi:hypothetical protein
LRSLNHCVCTFIPPHILRHLTHHHDRPASQAGAIALGHDFRLPIAKPMAVRSVEAAGLLSAHRVRKVFDAGGGEELPGNLLLDEERPGLTTEDVHAREAYHASGAMYDLLARVFLRNSIDNRGMPIISTIHFGSNYANACWNGR